ncbi:MAG: hypothetical protein FJX72_15430, partial [Armatimonadetes bacterium]|nr:hypothetical protein [Armatimonadota bacterium]
KRQLKEMRQASAYDLRGTPRAKALASERIRVLARWFRAFGKHGLVVFFDEMERIGNFTAKQRMATYEQVAWWADIAREEGSALLPVWFTTEDLNNTRHADEIPISNEALYGPGGIRPDMAKITVQALLEQSPRWRGWQALSGFAYLKPPDHEEMRALQSRVAQLYERAYGLDGIADLEVQSQADTVRQEIRRWIAYWDMQRLYPGYTPDIGVAGVDAHTEPEWDEDLVPGTDES